MFQLNQIVINSCYLVMIVGIGFIFYQRRRRIRKNSKEGKKHHALDRHMERVLFTISKGDEVKTASIALFYLISFTIFLFFFMLLLNQGFGIRGVILSLLCGGMPYLCVRTRMASTQFKASYEGVILMTELLNQYKMQYFNMIEAIDHTVSHLSKAPISKRFLFRLSLKLKKYQSEEELRDAINEFVFSENTQWAKMLANNISIAISDGVNVVLGMGDLLAECKQVTAMLEQGKRMNLEAFSIARFLAPAMYLGMIWMLYDLLELSIGKIVEYQLMTSSGLLLFVGIVMVGFINYAAITALSKRKFDF